MISIPENRPGIEFVNYSSNSSGTITKIVVTKLSGITNSWNGNISINSNWYAISGFPVHIEFDANGASLLSDGIDSCVKYNTSSVCHVKRPTVVREGWEYVGWNTNATATTNSWGTNYYTNASSSLTWYAITRATYTARFNAGGSVLSTPTGCSVIDIDDRVCTCMRYQHQPNCSINVPVITSNTHEVLGWNSVNGATSALWNESTRALNDNENWYAITQSRKYSVTINSGTWTYSGEGLYSPGDAVTVTGGDGPCMCFSHWSEPNPPLLGFEVGRETTTFTMPTWDVVLEVNTQYCQNCGE